MKDAWCSAVWARAHVCWQMSLHRGYLASGHHSAWSAQQAGRLCVCAEGVPTGDAPKQGEQVSNAGDTEGQALRMSILSMSSVLYLLEAFIGTAFSTGPSLVKASTLVLKGGALVPSLMSQSQTCTPTNVRSCEQSPQLLPARGQLGHGQLRMARVRPLLGTRSQSGRASP